MGKTTPRHTRVKYAPAKTTKPFSFAPQLLAATSAMIVATLFLSGEALVRFAATHLPTVIWFALAAVVAVYRMFSCAANHQNGDLLYPSQVEHPVSPPVSDRGPALVISLLKTGILNGFSISKSSASDRNVLSPQAVAAVVFFGWFAISSLAHIYIGDGIIRYEINSLFLWLGLGAAFFVFCELFKSRSVFNAIVTVLISVAFAQSMLGLYQYAVINPGNIHSYEQDKESVLAAMGIVPGSPEQSLFENRLRTNDPLGTYPMTNSLAGVLTPILILLIGQLFLCIFSFTKTNGITTRKATTYTVLGIVGLSVLAVAIVVCLALTKSRSGYAALVAGTICLFAGLFYGRIMSIKKSTKYAIIGLCAVLAVVAMILYGVTKNHDIIAGAKKSLSYRLEYWQATSAMIADNPILGCGPGNFQQAYTKYKLPQASEEIADPHNFVMEIASNAGIPALIAFLILVCTCLYPNRVPHFDNDDNDTMSVVHIFFGACIGVVIAYLFASLSGFPMESHVPMVLIPSFALSLAILIPLFFFVPQNNGSSSDLTPCWFVYPAFAAFFVNLSAAGGIAYPNVAITFWVLASFCVRQKNTHSDSVTKPIPISVNHSQEDRHPTKTGLRNGTEVSMRSRRNGAYLCAAVFFATAAVMCYNMSHVPGKDSSKWYDAALNEYDLDKRITYLNNAVDADPCWIESKLALSQMLLVKYRHVAAQPEKDELLRQAISVQDQVEAVAKISASANLRMSTDLANLYAETNSAELLPKILKRLRKAVSLYPNHAKNRAPFAVALYESGNKAEAIVEAKKAIELDDLIPHIEQKLPVQLRMEIERIANDESS